MKKHSMVAIGGILLILLVIGIHMYHTKPHTVYLNMKEVISYPISKIGHKLDQAKKLEFVKAYTSALPDTIKSYGVRHHVNIITATTLYDNSGVDITKNIINQNLSNIGA
jgi:hypothetical protein